mmetsp:Transcript_14256/g.46657  ORF Transcript_14256/g.46657 Transcript_14256/m.46657 type:complete len:230 (-) Transcript_14256:677-1366(-)|eukprot:scaffold21597_cov108-Isochrysis_galbana.AAC.3
MPPQAPARTRAPAGGGPRPAAAWLGAELHPAPRCHPASAAPACADLRPPAAPADCWPAMQAPPGQRRRPPPVCDPHMPCPFCPPGCAHTREPRCLDAGRARRPNRRALARRPPPPAPGPLSRTAAAAPPPTQPGTWHPRRAPRRCRGAGGTRRALRPTASLPRPTAFPLCRSWRRDRRLGPTGRRAARCRHQTPAAEPHVVAIRSAGPTRLQSRRTKQTPPRAAATDDT